jgi:hypothetical protein|tara:strand:- start:1646 stop:2014 length:369 start_codon:yes stop_codon:yes gene_type:complete
MANSILVDYTQREAELKKLQEQLEKMQSDPRLQKAIQFKNDVNKLMAEHEISADDAVKIIKPELADAPQSGPTTSKKRRLKRYTNPITEETVETRGGNNKTIQAWKEEHGEETVNSWAEFVD